MAEVVNMICFANSFSLYVDTTFFLMAFWASRAALGMTSRGVIVF